MKARKWLMEYGVAMIMAVVFAVILGHLSLFREAAVGKLHRGISQEIVRRRGQFRDDRAAIAFEEECRRPARRMIAAMVFGLDDQGPAHGRDFGTEARPSDAAADNQNIQVIHPPVGPFAPRLRIGKPLRLEP